MNYNEYISSNSWKLKRETRRELDGFRCRLCDHDGSQYRLEVHHRPLSYAKIPNESVKDDLITLCSLCHEAVTNIIRDARYAKRELEPAFIQISIKEIHHGMERNEIQVDFIRPVDNAQRANGGPVEQVRQAIEIDFIETGKDGRRL